MAYIAAASQLARAPLTPPWFPKKKSTSLGSLPKSAPKEKAASFATPKKQACSDAVARGQRPLATQGSPSKNLQKQAVQRSADAVARGPLVTQDRHRKTQAVLRLVPRTFLSAARIKRERAAKRSYDETLWRQLHPISIEVPWSAVKEDSLTPIGEDGLKGSQSTDRYTCFMDQCDKQKSAIGDHDVFEYPMGNSIPQELTPYVFNCEYEDATLQSHYLQAAAAVKHWFRETYKFYPHALANLFSQVSARPLGSNHNNNDPDLNIKIVLSLISKYQFQYRCPARRDYGDVCDEWYVQSEMCAPPENLTIKEFHVLPGDFGSSRILCPGVLVGAEESPIGDGAVYSMLCRYGHKWWSRHITGVNFPLYLWLFHDVDALSIECEWLKLPLIRQGKPSRGTCGGWNNKIRRLSATLKQRSTRMC